MWNLSNKKFKKNYKPIDKLGMILYIIPIKLLG